MSRSRLTFAAAACLFFLILGAKWTFVDRLGSDIPDWDQWDAEGLHLFSPWFRHQNFWHELFVPQNEHRIVPTKLQNLALTLANGQWDSRLECVTNAFVHTALAVALFLLGCRWLGPRWRAPWFLLIAACFALPLAWQNILGGFHSQQYWLLGLSFAAIVTLPFAAAWSRRWCLGALAAGLSLLAMGSGFLAAAAVFGIVILRWLRRATTLRAAWPTLALCLALCAIGWLTRVEVYYHASLKAHGLVEFLLYTVRSLQWPEAISPFAALVLWLPWLAIAGRAWREPGEPAPVLLAGLGGWVGLQILATAYARGAGADWPASRYMDTLALGVAFNGLALLYELNRTFAGARSHRSTTRMAGVAFALLWCVIIAHGFTTQLRSSYKAEVSGIRDYYHAAEENVRRYLATDDPVFLVEPDIPYPSAHSLRERIDLPELRALMPASIRRPLELARAGGAGFLESDTRQKPYPPLTAQTPGLTPATALLPASFTVGSFGSAGAGAAATGEWQSAPLTAPLHAWLRFETAGDLGNPAAKVALELHDASTHALLATIKPTKIPGDTWRSAYVRAPARPFVVVARDTDPAHWLAFSAPVEMGALSFIAWQVAKNGLLVLYLAAGAACAVGVACLVQRKDENLHR